MKPSASDWKEFEGRDVPVELDSTQVERSTQLQTYLMQRSYSDLTETLKTQ